MAGKKHTVINPASPSAQRNGSTAASNSMRQPKKPSASAAAAKEWPSPKPRKNSKQTEKPATTKKKRDKTEPQGGTNRKKTQASGEAATPTKKKKCDEPEPKPQKQKGAKYEKQRLSGEAEKPASTSNKKPKEAKRGGLEKPTPTKKQQASHAAEKPTPTKRKRGDAEPQKEAKSEKRSSGEGGTLTPTPAKKRKDKAATAAGADQGACSFPMARVRLLMRAEDASIRSSNEAVFLINKASELFLEAFAEDAYHNALKERKKSIIYDNLSTAVCNQKRYRFLSDFVPQKVAAGDALKATALKQS